MRSLLHRVKAGWRSCSGLMAGAGARLCARMTQHCNKSDGLIGRLTARPVRLPMGMRTSLRGYGQALIVLLVAFSLPHKALAAPAGTMIENTAQATYSAGGLIGLVSPSNTVTTVVTGNMFADPENGIVFDSTTGLPVDGATVTLINADTGLPATLFGADGVSSYPPTVISGSNAIDSSGQGYAFPPGGYFFSIIPPGNYRLVVTPPASHAFPSGIDTALLQALANAPFAIADPGSRGETFTINPGQEFLVDIPLDAITTALFMTKTANRDLVSIGDFVEYQLNVDNTTAAAIASVTVADVLPLGFRYQGGSTRFDGIATVDPAISPDGRSLTFTLGALAAAADIDIRYVVEVAAAARMGKATNQVNASGGGGETSNVATATVQVREDLFRTKTILMGRVIEESCDDDVANDANGVEGVRIYLEDGSFVFTDDQGMFHFEGVRAGTHVVQLDVDTLAEQYEIMQCENNTRFAGRAYSQFVDLQGGTMWRTDFHVALKPGFTRKAKPQDNAQNANTDSAMPEYNEAWLSAAKPGLAWLWPKPGHNPRIPSVEVAIKHHPSDKLALFLNGEEVSALNFYGTRQNKTTTVGLSFWKGVDLLEGDNHFEAIVYSPAGTEKARLDYNLHYAGIPTQAELERDESTLMVGGNKPAVIAVRLTDKDGHPVREGVRGEFSIEPPYRALQQVQALSDDPLSGQNQRRPLYTVGKNGIAHIRLQPTSRSGEAVLRIHLSDREQEIRAWLSPEKRDWILVGFAQGTIGHNRLSGNMQNLDETDIEDDTFSDGRVAFFAKGQIKGEWLLTLAYDTDKSEDEVGNSLHQTIDPDAFYTLYGDNTNQDYDAASTSKLYLKIERQQFYALFGDYSTGLTVTELSRYNRDLNGLKSEFQDENYSFNVFAADTSQAFVKDEIRGDGTSGLYRLSRNNIVINSEKIVIEARDRFRTDVVLSSESKVRHIDYNIDFEAGTLFFKEPIPSKDANLNPIFIVVDYESDDDSDEVINYGGRGAIKLMDQALEVGLSHIHEDQTGAEGDLTGIDLTYDIDENTRLKAELASSDTEFAGREQDGTAYVAELSHRAEKWDGSVYARKQEADFGLGQQKGSETGTEKIGVDASYRVNDKLRVDGQAYREDNLVTDAEQKVAEAGVNYMAGEYELHAGLRSARDTFGDGSKNESDQITLGVGRRFLDNRLNLRFEHDQSIGGKNESTDFPTRTRIGADYTLTPNVSVFGVHEVTDGDNEDTEGTRIGMRATPWKGGQISTSLGQEINENGSRIFSNLGLRQTWQINEAWAVDAGLDRSETIRDPDATPFNVNAAPPFGSSTDFTAVSFGAAYRQATWSWTSRLETRQSDTEDKYSVTTGIVGEPRDGLGLGLGVQFFDTESGLGAKNKNGDIRFSLAHRPIDSKWILLNRLDYLFEEETGGVTEIDNWRLVNNLNANYKPNLRTQLALQYGLKYVQDDIGGEQYSGVTDLIGFETRYDLNERWDVGGRASILHSWESDQVDYSYGVSVGFNVMENMWVSLGYNFEGFRDDDFSQAEYTAKGSFIKFRIKFDQDSMRDVVDRLNNE